MNLSETIQRLGVTSLLYLRNKVVVCHQRSHVLRCCKGRLFICHPICPIFKFFDMEEVSRVGMEAMK